jgi:hypothetical protein
MAIHFFCHCGKQLQASEDMTGLSIKCTGCGATLPVPKVADNPPDIDAPGERPSPDTRPDRRPDWDRDDEPDRARRAPGRTSGKAVTGFIFSLLALLFVCPLLGSILGLILSILGLVDVNRGQGRVKGKGLAITGIILSSISLILLPIASIAILVPAVQMVREAAARTQSAKNMRAIGFALHEYHDANKSFPAPAIYSEDGRPLLSWRVAILPHIGRNDLFQQFKLDEAWDGPNNLRLLSQMPVEFNNFGATNVVGGTFCQAIVGPGAAFEPNQAIRLTDIKDGPSNTILLVEAATAVPWTKPEDVNYHPNQPLPKIGGTVSSGLNVLFADGATRYYDIGRLQESKLRALITRAGTEPVSRD